MVIGKGIAKRDGPLMARHMIARRDQYEPIFRKRKYLQFFSGIDLVPDDTDFGKILGNGAHDLAAGTLLQIECRSGDGVTGMRPTVPGGTRQLQSYWRAGALGPVSLRHIPTVPHASGPTAE